MVHAQDWEKSPIQEYCTFMKVLPTRMADGAKLDPVPVYQVTVLYPDGTTLGQPDVTTIHETLQALAPNTKLAMKDLQTPWPSLDINAHGVNKLNAIISLMSHLNEKREADAQLTLEHVALGDAETTCPCSRQRRPRMANPGKENKLQSASPCSFGHDAIRRNATHTTMEVHKLWTRS